MRLIALLVLASFLTGCSCTQAQETITVIEKIHTPRTTGICVVVGDVKIPVSGGVCMGMVELVPDKFKIVYQREDGRTFTEQISDSEFESVKVGDTRVRRKTVCD